LEVDPLKALSKKNRCRKNAIGAEGKKSRTNKEPAAGKENVLVIWGGRRKARKTTGFHVRWGKRKNVGPPHGRGRKREKGPEKKTG